MDRKATTIKISKALEKHINPRYDTRIYMSKEVTFDYGSLHPIRVDYMLFKPLNNTISGIEKGDFYCYEIKSCVDDFHSKNGHNFIGDFNYYVMTSDTYDKTKDEIKYNAYVGVYVLDDSGMLTIIKKAKRTNRQYPLAETLLMMFRSANREFIKSLKEQESKSNGTV